MMFEVIQKGTTRNLFRPSVLENRIKLYLSTQQ